MFDTLFLSVINVIIWLLPLAGTVILGWIAWKLWVHYIQQDFISGITWVLLEIKPPRDVLRSPKVMELFLTNSLHHLTNKGLPEKYWKGAVPFYFSLEIVSLDGQVHFYVRVPSRLKGLIETQMYAQYPQAVVTEVEDYSLAAPQIIQNGDWNLLGGEYKLLKSDVYPIKTYVDFGLDKDPKEEYKIDPISPIVELFGSIEKGEQMWLQIVIRASNKKYHTHGTWFGHHDFVQEAHNEMSKMMKEFSKAKDDETEESLVMRAAPWQRSIIEAIDRKISKLTFECGIRVIYIAKKSVYNNSSSRNMRLMFKQFDDPHLNSFKRLNSTIGSLPKYTKQSLYKMRDRLLTEYRERGFFHIPLRHHIYIPWPISMFFPRYAHPHTFILNVEELATLWHFPGQILKVPGLERVESKEASPPTNLPT